jgi:DNA-binding FadR family transcriptional regulator
MEPDPANLIHQTRTYGARGVHGRVVEHIGNRIVRGELVEGEMLPKEAELMADLQTSRTTIREAIKVLAAKGLVETRQKRGTLVRPKSDWNLLDPDVLAWLVAGDPDPEITRLMIELRRLIEPGAARMAAARHDKAQLKALAAALDDMRTTDVGCYYAADQAFHRALFAATGNPFIDRLGSIVDAVLAVSFGLQCRSLIPAEQGFALHARVYDRIAARDAAGAGQAMLGIINDSQAALDRSIEAMGRLAA